MSRTTNPPPLILVVDDNLDAREMYAMFLEYDGFRSIQAGDGHAAIALARSNRPAVILMDATMPQLNGWDAAAMLKADPETKSIPLIMLTAHAFAEHRERALAVGADAFLAKPVLPDALTREIRRILKDS